MSESSWVSIFPGYLTIITTIKQVLGRILRTGPVPQHIGFVMDGNRRYARRHHIELKEGHNAGFESMLQVLELCYECGVKLTTVFAFSIENFKRSSIEVNWLMELAKTRFQQIAERGDLCEKYGVKIKILGDVSLLPKDVQIVLRQVEKQTSGNDRAILNVCVPYTARDDITHAIRNIVAKVERGELEYKEIIEQTITDNLYTHDLPPLEMLIRTSGTYRLSDFLLWECHENGCQFEITDTLWPEFSPWELYMMLLRYSYNHR